MSFPSFRFLALTGAVLLLSPTLQAQGQGRWNHSQPMNHRAFMGLHLTDAQKTQIKALRDQHKAAFSTKVDAVRAAHQAMRSAMMKFDTDAATLKGLFDKASAAQFDLLMERRNLHQAILPILTPEQRTKLEQRMSAMAPHGPRQGGWHRGFDHPAEPQQPARAPSESTTKPS